MLKALIFSSIPVKDGVAWAAYDKKGQPSGPGCLEDMSTAMAWPQMSFEAVSAEYHNKKSDFKVQFLACKKIVQQRAKGLPGPAFRPESTVATTYSHGYTMYWEVGFASQADIVRLSGGYTPQALKLGKPSEALLEDGVTILKGWFLNLRNLPLPEVLSMRKYRVERTVTFGHQEHVLKAGQQLRQKQGADVLSLLVDTQLKTLPSFVAKNNRAQMAAPDFAELAQRAEQDSSESRLQGLGSPRD